MDIYWFGLATYLQPLIWMILYNRKLFNPQWIYPIGVAVIGVLAATGWSSAHYTNSLLISYVLMVMYATYCYRSRPGFQPVCLAFLLVFLNSFYWEFPIHVADLLEGNVGVVLLQSVHLYVVPFLWTLKFSVPENWFRYSCYAWTVIVGLEAINLQFHPPWPYGPVALTLCRFIGLFTLLWILRFPGQPENRIISMAREVLRRHDHTAG